MDNKDIKKDETKEVVEEKNNTNETSVTQVEQNVSESTNAEGTKIEQPTAQQPSQSIKEEPVRQLEESIPEKTKSSGAFNGEEKIIYQVEPEKESNPLGTFIIFMVMIIGLLSLPFLNKLFNGSSSGPSNPGTVIQDGDEFINTQLEDQYFFEQEQSSIGIGVLEFKNFVLIETETGFELNFTLINNSENPYKYERKYYMDFYEGETLLYHALIHSYKALPAKGATELAVEISSKAYERADSIKLVETKPTLYPKAEFTLREEEYDLLTCKYDKTEIVYYFKDNLLKRIRETYTNTISIDASEETKTKYNLDKTSKQNTINKYREITGMNSNFVETDFDFTAQTDFDLGDLEDNALSNLKIYRFFKYHEKANVVAYEMPAMGYVCS